MDRQKTIPPLSTKITRKLAQESADHNTLMNFYSQISRDETGAPKKWKMSSTLQIDEDSIKSKKGGPSKSSSVSSNRGTPSSSRENSNERKSRINLSLQKAGRKGSLTRDSSSDQSSSRESSLESRLKVDEKKLKKIDLDKKNKSFSSDPGKVRKSLSISSSINSEKIKKKRGRPKSLDLSSKEMANGDDDNFKSPDPLTPCNIGFKRKKGRPKETPPVLYAEPPVVSSPLESMTDYETEDSSPPVKRKPGRPKKVKVFNTDQLKSIGKSDKVKGFNIKRQYGSKIGKTSLQQGFRRAKKLPKLKPVMTSIQNNKTDGSSMSAVEDEESEVDTDDKSKVKENGIPSQEKRKPGRPPGAKNKQYYGALTALKTRKKAVKAIVSRNRTQFGTQSLKKAISRGPGRPPGAKNKTTLLKLAGKMNTDKVETISNSSKENNAITEKDEVPDSFLENETEGEMDASTVDDAIETVLYKARNDISIELKNRPKVLFRPQGFFKKLSSVKSVAKFKKEKEIMDKIRKKRILESHASGEDFDKNIKPLASNDLRRKLQSKLIEKMKYEDVKPEDSVLKSENTVNETNLKSPVDSKTDGQSTVNDLNSEQCKKGIEVNGTLPQATLEEKTIIKPDTECIVDNVKSVRKQNFDLAKFSDTESVCSEISTNSIGSLKRNIEKQVLILGEDNTESDDQTVRTRQRFEIIPGKKRKRTLSGEFDLLDEKQLRKERKKAEKGQTDDESDINQLQTIVTPKKKPLFKRKISPNKKSPTLKVKDGKIVKKYVSQLTAYRNRLLKQSPFLSRVRKKRRKPYIKRNAEISKTVEAPDVNGTNESGKFNELENNVLEQTGESVSSRVDSPTIKPDNYRQGLFEKFTDVTLENDGEYVKENEVKNNKNNEVNNGEDGDSDDTECTIELKDDILPEEAPVEESVDDSDVIDFHAEVKAESTGRELYTESEIEIRDMLFELIDEIVVEIETKKGSFKESAEAKYINEKVEASKPNEKEGRLCNEIYEENSANVDIMALKKQDEGKLSEDMKEENSLCENVNSNDSKEMLVSEETIEQKNESTHSDTNQAMTVKQKDISEGNDIVKSGEMINEPFTSSSTVDTALEGKEVVKKVKIKHKMKRKRFIPLSKRKQQVNKIPEIRIGKKRGRKPKAKPDSELPSNTEIIPESVNEKKSTSVESKSPEANVLRKFELRQKISRSPLDNIALKQTLEENEYLRNEAQKLSRKEAKFKLKSKTPGQDSVETSPVQNKDQESIENTVPEIQDSLDESETETEERIESVEDLLKRCRPCKIILKDFIKELERAQVQTESSYESETESHDIQNTSDEEKGCSPGMQTDSENKEDPAQVDTQLTKTLEGDLSNSDKMDSSACKAEFSENENLLISNENVNNKVGDSPENIVNDMTKNVKLGSPSEQNKIENTNNVIVAKKNDNSSPETKQRALRPKRSTPVKIQEFPITKAMTPPKKGRKIKSTNEQQTARKTVPPLKIKLKGGFSSRRKTYIVEPSPDSPVEFSSKDEQKAEKKKEKSKAKSGNKSESSDSEKHSKNHHHRKKNKTPTDDINTEQNKYQSSHTKDIPVNQNAVYIDKPAIKPTDAYEATFLQFIQDKDKVEQNMAAFSSSLGSKIKPSNQSLLKNLQKDNTYLNMAMTKTNQTSTKFGPTNAPVQSDTQNNTENTDVQYVCSQCENVVYKTKEQIAQHYREVHPGSQFIYKPLQEATESLAKLDSPANIENSPLPSSAGDNEQPNDDDDSGSLNLKIVDVVSLKDQENIIGNDSAVSKEEQAAPVNTIHNNQIQTHLRIPSYPLLTSAPPPYPVQSTVLPPPYSIATAGGATQGQVMSALQEQLQLRSKLTPPKPKSKVAGRIGNSFKCEKCNVHAPMLAAMVAHLRNSHREIPRLFQCPYCKDMEAETEALIHQHIKKLHPTNNPNPPVALSEPAKRNLKTLSVRLPDGVKLGEGNGIEKDIYMCLKCKEHLPSLETIYEHLEHEHSEIFAYVCPVCKVFKSKEEGLVNNHIKTIHNRRPSDVNVSLAIDGNHFVRVQCLVKDKKSGQKSHLAQPKQQPSPVPATVQHSKPTLQVPGLTTAHLQLQPIPQTVIPQENSTQVSSMPLNSLQQPSVNFTAPPGVSKPTAAPGQKKKKSLLESIQKIKVQKMEQQGLLPQKSGSSISSTVPSHPSQLITGKPYTSPAAAPPPLMRAPPPLIRYDQLNKVSSPQSVMFGSAVRTTSQTLSNQASLTNLQRLQNITGGQNAVLNAGTARSIQSSLFDTSDLDSLKSPQSQRPVLNVPVVSRPSSKGPFQKVPSARSTPDNTERTVTGSPLDLSKTTPSASPVPQNVPVPNLGQVQVSGASVNPDLFQVFNLRPSTQMQLPRPQIPVPQMLAQPIMLPQQVRQNTPSTLAYRPAGSQVIATSQVPQLIGMPVGTAAVIGNMVVSLGNMTQGIPAMPVGNPGLQNAQFVRMSAPAIPIPQVSVLNSTENTPVAIQAQPKNTVTSQPILNKATLFRCPYCPSITPLRHDQVKTHIENKHPGSSVLFKPYETSR